MAGEIYAVPGEVLTEIADAIRAKTGGTEQLAVEDMASAIAGISGGGVDSQSNAALVLSDFDSDGFPTTVTIKDGAIEKNATYKQGAYGASIYLSKATRIICDPTIDTLPSYSLAGITEPPDGFERLDCYDNLKFVKPQSGLSVATVSMMGYFPPNIEEIGFMRINRLLQKSKLVSPLHIPASTKKITYNFAFTNIPEEIVFDGTPETMVSWGNNVVKTIKCPWAEGAVDGAPWGCTNATIIYNYVPEEEA